jgi:hypothetical protein
VARSVVEYDVNLEAGFDDRVESIEERTKLTESLRPGIGSASTSPECTSSAANSDAVP